MLFRLPTPPLAFEIPDEWLFEAGVGQFCPTTLSYRSHNYTVSSEFIVPLTDIISPIRCTGVELDYYGFRRSRGFDGGCGGMVTVLRAIVAGTHLPPITVYGNNKQAGEKPSFRVRDGYHRFYASTALGFSHIPCILDTSI